MPGLVAKKVPSECSWNLILIWMIWWETDSAISHPGSSRVLWICSPCSCLHCSGLVPVTSFICQLLCHSPHVPHLFPTVHLAAIATEFSPKPALCRFFHGSGTVSSFLKPKLLADGQGPFSSGLTPFPVCLPSLLFHVLYVFKSCSS